uniref:Uncharacterized protein n=1 Tax=Oryza sativa subsp. japonica TaxID=39947 RepID=Q33BB5_ORYSJ|nr:hypothetical protein LOC_Os10g03500 [Oryza sativa Japonica Group]
MAHHPPVATFLLTILPRYLYPLPPLLRGWWIRLWERRGRQIRPLEGHGRQRLWRWCSGGRQGGMQRGRSGASSFLPTGDSGKGEGWRWGHRLCPAPNTKIQWWGDKPSAVAPTRVGLGRVPAQGGSGSGFARASARAPTRPGSSGGFNSQWLNKLWWRLGAGGQ